MAELERLDKIEHENIIRAREEKAAEWEAERLAKEEILQAEAAREEEEELDLFTVDDFSGRPGDRPAFLSGQWPMKRHFRI